MQYEQTCLPATEQLFSVTCGLPCRPAMPPAAPEGLGTLAGVHHSSMGAVEGKRAPFGSAAVLLCSGIQREN